MTARQLVKYWLYSVVPGFSGRFRYFGTTIYLPTTSPLLRAICEQGVFEADIVERLVKLARPGSTMFDVGANFGLMSVPLLCECRTCRVVSFEPSPSSLPFLERTRQLSEFGERWTIIGAAAADQSGERDFTIGAPADALFEGFRSGDRIAGATTIKVPVTTLDETWRALGEPDVSVIKIDVEGAEAGVIAGGCALLQRQRPAILVEWFAAYLDRFGTAPAELLRAASRHGYRVFSVPAGVPVDDERALAAQMLGCHNFLLLS